MIIPALIKILQEFNNNSMDNKEQPKKKILLMGSEKSGKTSMFSIIFTQICPIETSLFENTKSRRIYRIK